MDYIVHGILQARILKWVAFPFSRGSNCNEGLNPGVPHCSWILYQLSHQLSHPGIPEGVAYPFSSPTQESNQGLLHCRWILSQLSYQGSPPHGGSRSQRKPSTGEVTRSPAYWEQGQQKKEKQNKTKQKPHKTLTRLSLRFQKTSS